MCVWCAIMTGACVEDELWQEWLQRSSCVSQSSITWWTSSTDNRTYSTEVHAAVNQPVKGCTLQTV